VPAPVSARGAGVSVELHPPVSFILRQTGAFRAALLDLGPLWERFSEEMTEIEDERFASEGHGRWAPLAESTLRDRARRGFGPGPILQRTGNLRESLVDPARAAKTTPRTMTWGSDVDYARYHQEGGSIPGRPPQRVVLEIRVEDRRRLETQMVSWINQVAARTFGRI
jgi:phage gpG-like protein